MKIKTRQKVFALLLCEEEDVRMTDVLHPGLSGGELLKALMRFTEVLWSLKIILGCAVVRSA